MTDEYLNAATPPLPPAPVLGNCEVILVDDDQDFLNIAQTQFVEQLGDHARITVAQTGKEAVALFKANPSAVVVLDLMMPDRAGDVIAAEMMSINPAATIIGVTALRLVDVYRMYATKCFKYIYSKSDQVSVGFHPLLELVTIFLSLVSAKAGLASIQATKVI